MPEFQGYLNAIDRHYAQWWKLYTLTDAEGKQKQESAPLFDFGLMAQTIVPAKSLDGDRSSQEKVERLEVTEALQKYAPKHVLLLGRPGSGKSTALARLMLELVKGEQIPVLVELRSYQSSIFELIRSAFKRHDLNLSIVEIEALLDHSRLILLIDGVNELPSESARTDLSNFRRDRSKVPMIFTTRDLGLGGDLGIEKQLEMQPLTETQMKAFVHAYLPGKADAMLGQLRDRLWDFGKTPLLLWMLCEVFDQMPNQQLPNNLAGIFQLFTRMYENSSVRKHEVAALKGDVRPLSDRRLWKPALKHLASVMMQSEKPIDFRVILNRAEAEEALLKAFPNEKFPARDILDDLLKYHLLQNKTPEIIEFRHQLIQEYYAAEWLLERVGKLDDETLECDYLNYLKWTEPLALMLALVDDQDLAVQVVDRALAVDLMLGAQLAGEVRSGFQEKTAVIVEAKVPSWLRSKSVRSSTLSEFSLFPPGYIPPLLETSPQSLLEQVTNSNCDYDDIWGEANTLGQTDSDITIPALLKLIENSDPNIRWRAATALGQIVRSSNADVISGLISLLGDYDLDVRRLAVSAIGNIGSDSAILALLTLIGDSDLCFSIVEALGEIGSDLAVPALRELVIDSDIRIREQIAYALGNIDSLNAISVLLQLLEDSHSDVSWIAADSICRIANKHKDTILIANILPELLSLLPSKAGEESSHSIQVIQANCKFYNYEIYQKMLDFPSQATARATPEVLARMEQTINQTRNQQMTEPSRIFHIQGNYIEKVEGGYHEHNYAPKPNTQPTDQLTNILAKLRTKYLNKTDAEIFEILLNSFDTMPQKNPQNWQCWQDIFSVLFSGGVEATKILVPVAGIPIEILKRLYEIYDRNQKQLPGV